MDTARCRAFVAAAESGSFTKAAEILNYTTSGISQLVTTLESDFDLILLERTRRGVKVTDAGEKLLPVIRAFLLQEQRMFQVSEEIKGLDVGEITIASYSSISTHWLPAIIKKFRADYPNIHIHLMEEIRQEVKGWLDEASADIGFLSHTIGYRLQRIVCLRFCRRIIRWRDIKTILYASVFMKTSLCRRLAGMMMLRLYLKDFRSNPTYCFQL